MANKTAPANISPAPLESIASTFSPGKLNSFLLSKPIQPAEP